MKISIITPIYNVASYLEATVHSVLTQTYADFELILVDDGSTDSSGALCDRLAQQDPRIRVIHQPNGGVSSARNTGVAAARGEFIGFVDSDDLVEPNMYEVLVHTADATGADVVQCGHDRACEVNGQQNCGDVRLLTGSQFVKEIFTYHGGDYTNQVALWSKIYRRKLFNDIVFPVGQTYEDEQETYKLCLQAKKIATMDAKLYHYVKRENSIITGVSPRKMLDKQAALRDRWHYLPERIPELSELCARSFYSYSINIMVELCKLEEKAAYRVAKERLQQDARGLRTHLDKYGKIYLQWLHIPVLERWMQRTDFEPIQSLLRRLRRSK